MKMIYKIIMILILTLNAFIFYSCAASYRSHFLKGAPSVTQIDYNVFRVTFRGDNKYMENEFKYIENEFEYMERNFDVVIYRSAELTHNNGYKFFTMMDEKQYKKESYKTPSDYVETRYVVPQITNTIIVCFKKKPKDFSYNAKFIIDSIKKKYALNDY